MSEAAERRSLFAITVIAAVALVCLLLGQRWVEGYLQEQKAKNPPPPDALHGAAGAAGFVLFADDAVAPGARVKVMWRDAAGRPGSTPSIADADGHFVQGNVPTGAVIVEVRASSGPLSAKQEFDETAGAGPNAANVRLVLAREFTLAGLVRRTGDRVPIAGASLAIAGIRATSGEGGEFRIEHVPAAALKHGGAVVRIEAQGFRPLDWPVPPDEMPQTYGDLTILMEPSK